jgi:dTDP-4-amino-4,6-dideoxygalactose transaminase
VKYLNEVKGFNSRLDEIQAAVLRVKLGFLDEWNKRRQKIVSFYETHLKETDLVLPFVPDWAEPVFHLFVVRSRKRDALRRYLERAGVSTLIHYPVPPHLQEAYRDLGVGKGTLPVSERIHEEVVSLPIGPHLSESQAQVVVQALREFA